MRRVVVAGAACCAAVALAGCGSSGGSPAAGTPSAPGSSGQSGAGQAGAAKHAKSKSKNSPSASLHVDTTPRFAAPSSSEPVQSGVVQIAYRDFTIDPDTVRVKVGSTVRWTNYDAVEHNVTSEGGVQTFASKGFGEGASFELKVSRPGLIHYESTNYPATMNGTIEVVS